MPWCALLIAVKNYNKNLENCKTFSSRLRPGPRPNVRLTCSASLQRLVT